MTYRKALGFVVILLGSVVAGAWMLRPEGVQTAIQRTIPDYLMTLQLTTAATGTTRATSDQITVLFSNRSADTPTPPVPFFGQDIIQEFSVSGMEIEATPKRIIRRVRDKSFVDARYIRVINHGTGGWNADKIWLTVDGEVILNGVSMNPRSGASTTGGLQDFNPRLWRQRVYWEAELQKFRKAYAR